MKLLIFDCDGTLVDSQHMIIAAMDEAFALAGLPAPAHAAVRSVIGLSLEGAVARLLAPDERCRAGAISEDYKAAFRDLRQADTHREPLFPGVHEAIHGLARRHDVRLAIATGKSRRGVDAVLQREGLASLFTSIQTADEHPSKPDPSMILRAMLETGAQAADTFMIGDTTFDMQMALAAGARAVGVGWGYHPAENLEEAGAHHIISSSEDLGIALTRLLASPAVAS